MADYVENGYIEGYVEGDSSLPSVVTECDLSSVLSELQIIKAQYVALDSKLNSLLNSINLNKELSLSINDKVVNIQNNALNAEQVKALVPFVDDISLKVYPIGTLVNVAGYDSVCTVVSSHFIPDDLHTYVVVYTVSHTVDGVLRFSDFISVQVSKYVAPLDISEA